MESTRRQLLRRGSTVALAGGGALAAGTGLFGSVGGGEGSPPSPSALVAGSLLPVAEAVPGGSVEAHGSLAARRLAVSGARDPDAVALADPTLFSGLVDRATLFATNALVLAYNPASPHAAAIADDWASALAAPDLALGRTDPEADPLGYRTVLAVKLAARFGIADRSLLDGSDLFPETALMRNLEGGAVDAAFAYRNMAVEHGLPHVELPERIDFSDPARAETYASVALDLEDRTVRGAPIRYAAAPLAEAGRTWCEVLTTGTERLRDGGFSVPEGYPRAVRID
jgi:molybdate/tungstate transport system substrate-binding protein